MRARVATLLALATVAIVGCTAAPPAATPERTAPPSAAVSATDEPAGQETQAGEVPSAEEALAQLQAFIPAGIVESCGPPSITGTAIAEVECELPDGSGADWVHYSLFASVDEMDASFDRWISSLDVEEGASCADTEAAVGPYSIGDQEVGRVVCTPIENSGAWIRWTDERIAVESSAMREDGDHEALYEWWTGDSGPNP